MITEEYVSFETAKLLKEKGFDEYSMYFYTLKDEGHEGYKSNDLIEEFAHNSHPELKERAVSCPTIQMAMKWLREKHKITIGTLFKGDRIYYEIHQNNEFVFGVDTPESYEKVCDEAIKYCLKFLI